ncbi:MAG: nucleotidyltransferase domain-containing protein [Nanoarchaeota archaeon]
MNLPEKYRRILDEFIEKYKNDKNVVGIILTGSFVHSNLDKNSDLDIHIILKDSKFRERGNTYVKGIEIEYFINPIKQIEEYFKHEKKGTAHMFSNSLVLYEKGNYLKKLIKKAKSIILKPGKKMSSFEIEESKYHLDDLEKDLEDVYEKKDWFAFEAISIQILEKAIETFLKIKRVRREKAKRLLNYLDIIDSKFSKLYGSVLLEKNYDKKYLSNLELIRYVELKLGGKRSKEWKLRDKSPYLNKIRK